MESSVPLFVASLGALVTVAGYFLSNSLERRRTLRLRETEFRLDRYKEFLLAFSDLAGNPTYEAWLRFSNGINTILLIGSADLLGCVRELVDNFNDEAGTMDDQHRIMQRILFHMRGDLGARDADRLAGFKFPVVVPPVYPETGGRTKSPKTRG
jgi:hypothetical protein